MRSSRINYIAVGAFVLIAVAGLMVAIALLTGRTGPTDEYFTRYDNVAGVRSGTPVRFEGYRVGQVSAVKPVTDENGVRFRVEFFVEHGFPIPEDSRAMIASAGILAGSSIEIERGGAKETLQAGAMIEPGPTTDPMATMTRLVRQVNDIDVGEVQSLLETVSLYAEGIGETLLESTPRMLGDLEMVTESIRGTAPQIARNLDEFLANLNQEIMAPENIVRLERTLRNVDESAQSLNEDVLSIENRDRLRAILSNFDTSSRNLAQLSSNLERNQDQVTGIIDNLDEMVGDSREPMRESVENLRYTLDAVSRNIDSITRNLEGASRNMSEFSRQIRQNPSLLLRGRPAQQD